MVRTGRIFSWGGRGNEEKLGIREAWVGSGNYWGEESGGSAFD